mmetsp:Transcript_200/g.557  ORF Transcript_200/g.557 Transcript_200/m.557 type:complete len:219 (+) Transcript_200:925-1581(+)
MLLPHTGLAATVPTLTTVAPDAAAVAALAMMASLEATFVSLAALPPEDTVDTAKSTSSAVLARRRPSARARRTCVQSTSSTVMRSVDTLSSGAISAGKSVSVYLLYSTVPLLHTCVTSDTPAGGLTTSPSCTPHEEPSPSQTPHASSLPLLQQEPPASMTPPAGQQTPKMSKPSVEVPPHTPHASTDVAQHLPWLSLRPLEQQRPATSSTLLRQQVPL